MLRSTIALAALAAIFASAPAPAQTTAITYQGELKDAAMPATGTFDMQFKLWDDLTPGPPDNQIGATLTRPGITVTDGIFQTQLDFGLNAFVDSGLRYLEINVRPTGGGAYTTLSPRQWITATPQSVNALNAISAQSLELPFYGASTTTKFDATLYIDNNAPDGFAIRGDGQEAGVLGTASFPMSPYPGVFSGTGVAGISSVAGVHGSSDLGYGVVGWSFAGTGGYFQTRSNTVGKYALYAESTMGSSAGLFEINEPTSSHPVLIARTDTLENSSIAVHGIIESTNPGSFSSGVRGENRGTGPFGIGVWGSHAGSGWGVYGTSGAGGKAGYFSGDVIVTGTLSKGGGAFKIDHPLDPQNMYLSHSFVESPDMKNIYDGVITLDDHGRGIVTLPTYFDALNQEFRYQLTCIGGYAPVYIESEIADRVFTIAGGSAGLKVSWQVTGVRHDAWARQNQIQVEQEKSSDEKGRYLHPEAFGQPKEKGIGYQPVAKDKN